MLEGRYQLPEEVFLGYISSTTKGLETAVPLIKEIIEPDLEEYTSKLGYDVKFRFLIDDAQGKAARHLEIVQGYKARGVKLFSGGGWSSQAYGSLSYCNDNDMLMFSPSSQSPLLSISEDNLFRLCQDDTVQAKIISDTIHSLNIDNVVVLQRGDAWADGIYNYFAPLFTEHGGSILKRIRYDINTQSFAEQLETLDNIIKCTKHIVTKIAVFLIAFDEATEIISLSQEYEYLYKIPWFGTDATALSQNIIEKTQEQASHLNLYSPYASPVSSLKFNQLYERFSELTGHPFGYYSACTYDIAGIIVQSILEAQSTNTQDIISILPQIAWNHFGASGWTSLNDAGDRRISDYQIWAYTNEDASVKVVATYDGLRNNINWSEVPQQAATTTDTKNLEDDRNSLKNHLSRIFEDTTADYLRNFHGYTAKTRFKPVYLKGKEVDVFAEVTITPRKITICECKLRFNNQPITLEEINYFSEKIKIIAEEEIKRENTVFHNWIVTNTDEYDNYVVQYAHGLGIELIKADIGNNWQKRPDWKINKITKIKVEHENTP